MLLGNRIFLRGLCVPFVQPELKRSDLPIVFWLILITSQPFSYRKLLFRVEKDWQNIILRFISTSPFHTKNSFSQKHFVLLYLHHTMNIQSLLHNMLVRSSKSWVYIFSWVNTSQVLRRLSDLIFLYKKIKSSPRYSPLS